jgi:hypothetical protein
MENEEKKPRINRAALEAWSNEFSKVFWRLVREFLKTWPGRAFVFIAAIVAVNMAFDLIDYIQLQGVDINPLLLGILILSAILLRVAYDYYKKKKDEPKVKEILKNAEEAKEKDSAVSSAEKGTIKIPYVTAGWAFFIEMVKTSWLLAIIVLAILHGSLYEWWPDLYRQLWHTKGFILLHLFLAGLIMIGPFLKTGHPIIKGLTGLAFASVVIGFGISFWSSRPVATSKVVLGSVTKDELYPMPDRLPPDTQFVMVAMKERRSPKIVIPVYYGIEFTFLGKDQANCIDVYTQLGGPFEMCQNERSGEACPWTRLEDPEIVQVASRMPETRVKIRLYDSRVATSQRVC